MEEGVSEVALKRWMRGRVAAFKVPSQVGGFLGSVLVGGWVVSRGVGRGICADGMWCRFSSLRRSHGRRRGR